ncbi:serine/threonine protein kinase [Niveibacterium sp. SC-1]|uniref:serine/threonine protein kinase n=1 Tax=Niveibacterium sp. SC-1 TaxID=3135646 RepID=UPI0031201C93
MSAPESTAPPFADLTPDCVLGALESVGFLPDGRFHALNSYENRVYLIWMDDGSSVVAKFYRPERWSDAAIQEEHDFTAELAGHEIPVVAPLTPGERSLHEHAGFRFAVYPRRGGRAPELDDPKVLEWIGRFMGRIHAVGAARPFAHRPTLDIASFGEEPRAWLLAHDFIPPELRKPWETIVGLALDGVRAAFDRAGDVAQIRLHGDCHAGNLLWTPDGPHFVDFDDCRRGPAIQDLWMLLSGDRQSQQRQLLDALAGYEDFMSFDPRELHLIEALRTLRLIHYSAWIARRWNDPAFPAAFSWFNTQRYWEERVLELREQVAAMDEPPLRV